MSRTNPLELQWAKQAAKRLFKKYNYQGSELGQYEVSSLLSQTYQLLNVPFKPTSNDIRSYTKVLDSNLDGHVTIEDLEALCIKFLCDDGPMITTNSSNQDRFGSYNEKTQQNTIINQGRSINSVNGDRYGSPQSPQQQKYQESYRRQIPSINNYEPVYSNIGAYSKQGHQQISNIQISSPKNIGTFNTNNSFTDSNKYISNYNFVKTSNDLQLNSNIKQNEYTTIKINNTMNEYVPSNSNTKPNQFVSSHSNSKLKQYPQGSFESNHSLNNFRETSSNVMSEKMDINTQSKQQASSSDIISSNPIYSYEQQPTYSKRVQEYLDLTKLIFERNALKETNTITAYEVPDVLSQTYQALGRSGYRPSADDVAVWMKLCDGNSDGHVEYDQYEYFVVRSLERSGVNLYQDY